MIETIKDYHIIDRETIKNQQSVVSSSMVLTIINVLKYQNNEDKDEDDNGIEKLEAQTQKFRIM
jgi:hypothetical protein